MYLTNPLVFFVFTDLMCAQIDVKEYNGNGKS